MNVSEAKQIKIIDFLQANGINPFKISHGSAIYFSPLRNEKTPSFSIDLQKNVWYDFGIGEGGNLIGLVMKLNSVNVSEALELINSAASLGYKPFEFKMPVNAEEKSKIVIVQIIEISHPALLVYLTNRKVSIRIARHFLKEVHYILYGKKFFALAFKNDLGGYELRNSGFKGGNSPKWFTTIPGTDTSKLMVFEGFMDFLSWCTFYNKIPAGETVILNSLSFLPRIKTLLLNAREVNLFLDNDPAGSAAAQKIRLWCVKVKDWAPIIYPDHKDFNDFLMKKNPMK
jgi:DNA primase